LICVKLDANLIFIPKLQTIKNSGPYFGYTRYFIADEAEQVERKLSGGLKHFAALRRLCEM